MVYKVTYYHVIRNFDGGDVFEKNLGRLCDDFENFGSLCEN